mmetsp:Transcript_19254/g.29205  ORF Transcript_19254/g.29205 Transcript_19254/m.29205 type:complete len:179 (-) Transcript_19254:70-606(-)
MKSITLLSILLQTIMLLSPLVKSFTLQSTSRVAGRRYASVACQRSIGSAAVSHIAGRSASTLTSPSFTSYQPSVSSSMTTTTTTSRWMSTPGSEDGPSVVETCREKICVALETDDVKVIGAYDDPNGSHIAIEVTSALFEGKRPVQRQQLVYKALWEELQGAVHAVDSMVCKTPAEKN